MNDGNESDRQLDAVMPADRYRLKRSWQRIQQLPLESERRAVDLARWEHAFAQSAEQLQARMRLQPTLAYDTDLPITAYRSQLIELLQTRQTLVVCGETGSGKSTQLPKLCLEAGLGRKAMIGHTQPRRLAARSIANRLAEELETRVGEMVGFKIRFTDKTNPTTLVKLMTDGVLLAEIQRDRFLDAYDTIIIDEAHERSLNIDLLMAYLCHLLDRRPDLKLIITSATIDAERFSTHFTDRLGPAPILNVEGRTYPVEVRYRGPEENRNEEEVEDHWLDRLMEAVDELFLEGSGDILVFLASERDIRDAAKRLRGHLTQMGEHSRTEVLPLYSRLTEAEQQRVFQSHSKRRIVLATNVAESSLTVPGIRYVIDTGTARISRYAPRSKVQRLPIEAIAQASADQRAGRCGRVGPGICIRLFSEGDYAARGRFTTPEIRRTNLASAILQTRLLGVGHLEQLPLLDPPRPEVIRDGIATLRELRAIDDHEQLTDVGRKLGRWPVDPRVGRMLLEANQNHCLADVLVIASGLEVQDPRLRPPEQQAAADQAHAKFNDLQSDFISLLRIWDAYHRWKEDLGRSRLEKACRENFLSLPRLREWSDIHRQLVELTVDLPGARAGRAQKRVMKTELLPTVVGGADGGPGGKRDRRTEGAKPVGEKPVGFSREYEAIHTSLLSGLLSGIGILDEERTYKGASNIDFQIWPGSSVKFLRPRWLMAAEVVETHQRYARTVAAIDPAWIERLAEHLLKPIYEQPHFSRKHGSAMVYRRSTLFGLPVIPRQQVPLAPVDPELARRLLIDEGLVEGELQSKARFYQHNQNQLTELHEWAQRTRSREMVIDPYRMQQFYDLHLPKEVVDRVSLEQWDRTLDAKHPIRMTTESLLAGLEQPPVPDDFPEKLQIGATAFPVQYRFEPGSEQDGVSIQVPAVVVTQLQDAQLQWMVPGLLEEKILGLIKTLPKSLRRNLVPAPDTAAKVAKEIRAAGEDEQSFWNVICKRLGNLAGEAIQPTDFELDKLPAHLRMRVEVVDDHGKVIESSRSVESLQTRLGTVATSVAAKTQQAIDRESWYRSSMTTFDIPELPEKVQVRQGGLLVELYPAIVVHDGKIQTELLDRPLEAERRTREATVLLFSQVERRELRSQVTHLPRYSECQLRLASRFGAERMRDGLGDLIAKLAFMEDQATIRSQEDFELRRIDRVKRISIAAQEIAKWLPKLADQNLAVSLLLEKSPATWNANVESIEAAVAGAVC